MQLPSSNCNYRELNYTLILESNIYSEEQLVVESHIVSSNGVVVEGIVKLDFKEIQKYSIALKVDRLSRIAMSQKYFFSKF